MYSIILVCTTKYSVHCIVDTLPYAIHALKRNISKVLLPYRLCDSTHIAYNIAG